MYLCTKSSVMDSQDHQAGGEQRLSGNVSVSHAAPGGYYQGASGGGGADYYAAGAGREGKEPDGTWTGDGCRDLGIEPGSVVDGEAFKTIYDNHVDPRDGSRIGRALTDRDVHQLYAEMLNGEPGATAERRQELFTQAQARAAKTQSVRAWDATFEPGKSVTLLHASARAMRLAAEESGDKAQALEAQRIEDAVWRAISDGAAAGMAHLQAHAGYTRTGAGGVRKEDAHRWVVANWRQHTSRAGDPHLHQHQVILNKVVTERDGRWRTIEGNGLFRERGAAAAISTMVMENALTRDLGVQWVQREDGHGREIKGVSQALMDEFSTRSRDEIPEKLAALVDAYRETYGHDPDARDLASLSRQAARLSRDAKQEEDLTARVREWAVRASRDAGEALAPLAGAVCGQAQPVALTQAQEQALMAKALGGLQARQSTWTRSDLTRAIGEALPADFPALDPAAAASWLPAMAERAIRGDAGQVVVALEAPELFTIPDHLRRADGESVYQAHGATRFATEAQLRMEGRIREAAAQRDPGVPRITPGDAAQLLGADAEVLQAQLDPRNPADVTTGTGSGLHLDQAAAAFSILTSDRRGHVLVGPAGTGKSFTVAEMARIWQQANPGARVIGLATTQQGANVLRGMGITDSHNIAMFLTDPRLQDLGENALVVVDEASTASMPHLARLLALAEAANAKLMLAGDHAQHEAVHAGGGMGMLARYLGYVQLGEALRFTEPWQREASLLLRAGDVTAVTAYDQHGRIVAGSHEFMLEQAGRRFVNDYVRGRDSVLIARTDADAREMSRRVREDLIHFGFVKPGPAAALKDGAVASAGDRIMTRRNDHQADAGAAGRTLANRDLFKVEEVLPGGSVSVRLVLGRGDDGKVILGEPRTLPAAYLREHAQLAYGMTSYAVQGATFDGNGYAVVRPEDDREYLYTAMTRARGGNFALVVDHDREMATGPDAASPEAARARMLAAERDGREPGPDAPRWSQGGAGILANVLARGERELSATETLEAALGDADSLRTLLPIWTDLAASEHISRYDAVLRAELGDEMAASVTGDYRATWLYRTLRAGELAGMDGAAVLRQAAAQRDLGDVRSVAAVLDHRARQIIPAAVPLGGGWATRTPTAAEPGTQVLLDEIGRAMDARTSRLGEHAVAAVPLWAERNLGAVPDDPAARQEWQDRAAAVAAYREIAGYSSPGDAIGAPPSVAEPEARAAWHTALAALGRVDGIDLTGIPEPELESRRALFAKETAWAPAHVGRELRVTRQARHDAAAQRERAEHEARVSGDKEALDRHQGKSAMWGRIEAKAATAEARYGEAMAARQAWDRATEPTRRMAMAADLESRRRDPWAQRDELRSAEPASDLLPDEAEPDDARIHAALGLTPDTEAEAVPDHPERMAEASRAAQARADEIAATLEPSEDPDVEPSAPWTEAAARQREAVTQEPAVPVRPAERVPEPELEAG